jgi:hypothetical protein
MAAKRPPQNAVLPPNGVAHLKVQPPIEGDETPVVLSQQPQDVTIQAYTKGSVTVENRSSLPLPCMMVIIPTVVADAIKLPWQQGAHMLFDAYGRDALSNIFDKLLDKYVPRLPHGGSK